MRARLGGAALILGAQTDLPMVRRAVCEVGYRIRREVIASAGGRDYVLMRCTPALAGEAAYTERECVLGPGLLRAPSPGVAARAGAAHAASRSRRSRPWNGPVWKRIGSAWP